MSLIEKLECNDGTGAIYDIILLNKIDTILDIFSLDDEHIKATYKSLPSNKTRIYLTLPQRNSISFL